MTAALGETGSVAQGPSAEQHHHRIVAYVSIYTHTHSQMLTVIISAIFYDF